MVGSDNEEIERMRQKLQEKLIKRAELKLLTSENEKDIKSCQSFLDFLLGTPFDEISSPRTISQILTEILKEANRPLHARELVEALRRGYPGFENTGHQTVTGALIRNVNKGKRFKRVAPNVYDVLKEGEENSRQK